MEWSLDSESSKKNKGDNKEASHKGITKNNKYHIKKNVWVKRVNYKFAFHASIIEGYVEHQKLNGQKWREYEELFKESLMTEITFHDECGTLTWKVRHHKLLKSKYYRRNYYEQTSEVMELRRNSFPRF